MLIKEKKLVARQLLTPETYIVPKTSSDYLKSTNCIPMLKSSKQHLRITKEQKVTILKSKGKMKNNKTKIMIFYFLPYMFFCNYNQNKEE